MNWTVDYKPYELDNIFSKIEDTLPMGLDLRTDEWKSASGWKHKDYGIEAECR